MIKEKEERDKQELAARKVGAEHAWKRNRGVKRKVSANFDDSDSGEDSGANDSQSGSDYEDGAHGSGTGMMTTYAFRERGRNG
jgi:hypothetical protein